MSTQVQEATDTRWNDDSRTGSDASKAAVSLARVWRGYILCAYLDNDKNSENVWTTIYDPYTHDQWIGSEKIPIAGIQANLTSAAPPAVAYLNLNAVIITAASSGQTLLSVLPYPVNADSPDEFKNIPGAHFGPAPVSDLAVPTRPAIINFNDELVFVYRNKSNALAAVIGTMNPQKVFSWSPAHAMGASGGTDGPSLTFYQGRLFCAYTAQGGQIMVASSADGVTWSAWSATGAFSAYGPALSADPLGYSLILMYADGDSKRITTRNSGDGHTWSAPEKCNGQTQDAPALVASAAGLMLAVYRGSTNDNVYYVTTKPGLWNYLSAAQSK
jgi:hypothetical protein